MSLKLYYDLLSQPSRAVYIFLKATSIPFEAKPIALRKNVQLTDDFKEISRFQKVPVIDDNGFKLNESVAILRYLAREKSVAEHWYPKDSRKQAKIDEYMAWQHHNTRFLCNFYFQRKYLTPLKTGVPTSEELIEQSKDRMLGCLEKIEEIWLGDSKFLASDELTIADLLGVCELEQTRIAGFDPRKDFARIGAWMDRVRNELNPFYDEAHSIVYKLADRVKVKQQN